MERVSFEIESQDIVDALHAQAEAHGHSVEAEVAELVERTYAPKKQKRAEKREGDWVDELIRIAGGADPRIPDSRDNWRTAPDYPEGMDPLPGESFVDHITRISRPGIGLDAERDRTPHGQPRV